MGIPANRNDYVYWEDEYKLAFDDLSAEQRQFLVKLNNRLSEIEKGIREEGQALIDQLKKRIRDSDDWLEDFEIEGRVLFFIRKDDPYYDDEGDNLLIELSADPVPKVLKDKDYGIGNGYDHNTLQSLVKSNVKDEIHCYLYHSLYDHTELGWINILRIGSVWIELEVIYQKFVDI
ncbi:MAG: hypothetical protein AB7S77_09710 [Desulfatirhabdiaceae bacterium]